MQKIFFQDILDTIKYDIIRLPKPRLDKTLMNAIPHQFDLKVKKDDCGYTFVFPSFPGMVLFAESYTEALDVINDGLSTYFDIPRYYAKNKKYVEVLKDSRGNVLANLPTSNSEQLLKAYT